MTCNFFLVAVVMHFSLVIAKHILVCSNMSEEFTITILKSANLGTQLRMACTKIGIGFVDSYAMQDVKLEYFL